jgi:Tol biopolymer transport system component
MRGSDVGEPGIFAWYPDGRVQRVSPPAGFYADPCVHPDGSRAVFWGGALGTPGVWQTNLESGKCFRLTSMASGSWHASYTPAGDAIVLVSDRFCQERAEGMEDVSEAPGLLGIAAPVQAHVFTVRLDGRGVRQLTEGACYDRRPAASPDGRLVAFASGRGGAPGIWVAPLEAKGHPRQVASGLAVEDLCWSADGSALYVAYRVRDTVSLASVRIDGGPLEPLGLDLPEEARAPRLAPDGSSLLVEAPVDGRPAIFEVPLDAGTARRLSPPGFASAGRPSRSRDGVIVFASSEALEGPE